jgi:23S rRNA (cytidine1920-2'-O)/16S rRNA (cytidine1409-2'-O)-methyltransferase
LAESGAKAQALILAGSLQAPGFPKLKPGLLVSEDQPLNLLKAAPYVSRGGEKLAGALLQFGVRPAGFFCLDVGASTGGFTDCLLQKGAEKVLAVDVGTAQLHEKLRRDLRVTSQEKTHVLSLTARDFQDFSPRLVTVDVSFISLEKVLPHLASLTLSGTEFLALVKPQFEVGPKQAPKGVVRDPKVRQAVLDRISSCLPAWGFEKKGDMVSPLKGPQGNVEFFLYFVKGDIRPQR